MHKLFIDDLRTPQDDSYVIVRTYDDAVNYILKNGMPDFISFDHDLGLDKNGEIAKSGYDFAKWITDADIDGKIEIPEAFLFAVHSQNPVGKKNIESLLTGYMEFKRKHISVTQENTSLDLKNSSEY